MKINWKDWDLVTSASQLETWDDCRRKWWFQKPQKMPELDKGFQIYGNVIHAVADRFFGADDLGYDTKTKKPIDLYPTGWEISRDRTNATKVLGTVTPQEQAQIKLLVKRAIEEGIWTRMPNREAEASFFRKITDRIAIIGYIDLLLPDEVVDHKSTKNMRYAKSGDDLLTNTQMLVYAKECITRADEKGIAIEGVNARHNIFSKDPKNPVVKAVVTPRRITRAEIEAFWQTVKEKSIEMRKLKKAGISQENWSAVRGPDDKKTCEAYGGCAFQGICNKRETPIQYRARIELAQKGQQEGAATLTTNGDSKMGLFDKLKTTATAPTKAAATAPAKAAPPSMPKPPPELQTQKVQPTKEQAENTGLHPNQSQAPWARENCRGCKSLGITKAGTPCRVCDTLNKKDGKPTSSAYTLAVSDDGLITWTDAAGETGSTPAVAAVKVTDKTTAPTSTPAAAAAPAQAQPASGALGKKRGRKPKAEEAPAQEQTTEVATEATPEVTEPGKPGRPKTGFTLLIGCLPERGKQTGIINLDQVFNDFGTELAQEMGSESYFALDGYKRRDWMAMRAKQIADTFESKTVTAVGESPDFREFLAAIKPFAAYVYVGVA